MNNTEKTPVKIENKPKKPSSNLWTIIAFLVFATLMTIGYKFKDILSPKVSTTAALNTSCDLREGPCSSKFPNGDKVTLSINPNDIRVMRPLALNVEIDGVEATEVEVDFIGLGMEMGYNRPKLEKINNNTFKGDTIIPVCVRSKMEWEARVLLQTDNGLIMAPFRFYTLK